VAGCCECGDESSGFCATELVTLVCSNYEQTSKLSDFSYSFSAICGKGYQSIVGLANHFDCAPKLSIIFGEIILGVHGNYEQQNGVSESSIIIVNDYYIIYCIRGREVQGNNRCLL
jgi:hypothetical protein